MAWDFAPWLFVGLALAPVLAPKAKDQPKPYGGALEGVGIFLAFYYALRGFLAPHLFDGELAFADAFAGTLAVAEFALAAWHSLQQRKSRRPVRK